MKKHREKGKHCAHKFFKEKLKLNIAETGHFEKCNYFSIEDFRLGSEFGLVFMVSIHQVHQKSDWFLERNMDAHVIHTPFIHWTK